MAASGQEAASTLRSLLPDSQDTVDKILRDARNSIFDARLGYSLLEVRNLPPGPPPPPPPGAIVDLIPTPELPLAESDSVLVGYVVQEQPFLSKSRSSLYTEYTVKVTDSVKPNPLTSASEYITLIRRGGVALTSDGRRIEYRVRGEGDTMNVGERYLFFLEYRPDLGAYLVNKMWHADGATINAAFPMEKTAAAKLKSKNDGRLLAEVVSELKAAVK